jgi:hypothetical protein
MYVGIQQSMMPRVQRVPLDQVAHLYARVLAVLTAGARITRCLAILATR